MAYDVQHITVKDELKVCPGCGYEDGFHSMLKKEEDGLRWLFICPACHAVYDVDYTVEMSR